MMTWACGRACLHHHHAADYTEPQSNQPSPWWCKHYYYYYYYTASKPELRDHSFQQRENNRRCRLNLHPRFLCCWQEWKITWPPRCLLWTRAKNPADEDVINIMMHRTYTFVLCVLYVTWKWTTFCLFTLTGDYIGEQGFTFFAKGKKPIISSTWLKKTFREVYHIDQRPY